MNTDGDSMLTCATCGVAMPNGELYRNEHAIRCTGILVPATATTTQAVAAPSRLPEGFDWSGEARVLRAALEEIRDISGRQPKGIPSNSAIYGIANDVLAVTVEPQAVADAHPPSASPSAPEGNEALNHRAQAIYDVLMARGLVSPLDGMRKLGVYHAILDGLLVKLDADGEPTQAAKATTGDAASVSPEGNDEREAATNAIDALMRLGACIQNDRGTWKIRKPHDDMQALMDEVNRTVPLARAALRPLAGKAHGEPDWILRKPGANGDSVLFSGVRLRDMTRAELIAVAVLCARKASELCGDMVPYERDRP